MFKSNISATEKAALDRDMAAVYGTAKILDCANCRMNCGEAPSDLSMEVRLPCGQYNCWIRLSRIQWLRED